MSGPLRVLSLGAGVQSTTLLLLAASRELPRLDAAIFADTGWEPRAVYDHLARIEREVAEPAGIPIIRVHKGDLRSDALNPDHRFASMPVFVKLPGAKREGMMRRQCTNEYKLGPIKQQVRAMLGYPHPKRVPKGVYADTWVGISTDEVHRAKDSDVQYQRLVFPLLDLGLSRRDCLRLLHEHGYPETPKSACIGCPFHGNRHWRTLRDKHPDEWADAVDFDARIRHGHPTSTPLIGEAFLHSSCLPLDQAPIDVVQRREKRAAQLSLLDLAADIEAGVDVDGYDPEDGFGEDGCGPWACRSDGLPNG